MKIEIKNRFTGAIIFEMEAGSMRIAVQAAVEQKVSLADANLAGADLAGADLADADLAGADLADADLAGANLAGADLADADLAGADLAGADLAPIRDDIWAVLSAAPSEAQGLREALAAGRINGSAYEGECACLVGTIAKLRKCEYTRIPGLKPDADRPAEQWFMQIKQGDTPETNQCAARAVEWIDQWIENVRGAFAESK